MPPKNKLANNLRTLVSLRDAYVSKSAERISNLVALCEHPDQVILESAYRGSAYDHDDRHEETRLCLHCGTQETGPSFRTLRTPKHRFEFGGSKFFDKLDATPLGRKLLCAPIEQVLDWVRANGHRR